MNLRLLISLIVFFTFFLVGIFTIPNYGISWDEPEHYHRGQAYVWYFLTGEKTYENLPQYDVKRAKTDKSYHERSIYQTDSLDFNYWVENDGDHPVLNDILASFFNFIFYQKMGIADDIQSYHLFEILVASLAVAAVFYFGWEVFNFWVGLFAALTLATYPLFWAEAHFNIKDPAETSFILLTIYFFWKAINLAKIKYILISAFFAGIAFAIKFNILFLPFILIPWILLRQLFIDKNTICLIFSKKFLISFIFFPLIMYGIFAISWPYIWQDIVGNTIDVFKYYERIGLESNRAELYLDFFNSYALRWFIYTVQPLILVYFIFTFLSLKYSKTQKDALILWLFWLVVPIVRVSIEGATIYGGIRQIMEFMPALALISGVGVNNLGFWLKQLKLAINMNAIYLTTFLASSVILLNTLIQLHPNENVYFNSLSGGLKKNYDQNFPATGNTLGNVYKQGINWINQNANTHSKLALVQGTTVNIPTYWIRPDIAYSNYHWSGIKREGEYLMELTHIYDVRVYFYAWDYVETMLEPIYQIKVDNVPLLKIWKNDFAHTKKEFQKSEQATEAFQLTTGENQIKLEFDEEVFLSRIVIKYNLNNDCIPVKYGTVYTSSDNQNFREEGDRIPFDQLGREKIELNSFRYMFAARKAKYVKMSLEPNSCALLDPQAEVLILK